MASYCSDQCQSIAWEEQGHQEECEQGQVGGGSMHWHRCAAGSVGGDDNTRGMHHQAKHVCCWLAPTLQITIKGKLPSQAALDEALAAMGPIMNLPLAQQLQALQQQVMDMTVAAAAAAAATPPKASRASSKGSRASAGSTPKSKASTRGIGFAGVGDDGDTDVSAGGSVVSAMRRSEGSTGAGSSRTDEDVESLVNQGDGEHDDEEEDEPWGEEVLERGRATPAAALLRDRRGRNAAAPARPHAGSAGGVGAGEGAQAEDQVEEPVASPMASRRKRQTGMPRFVLNDAGSLESDPDESEHSDGRSSQEDDDDDDGYDSDPGRVLVPLVEHVPNVLQLGGGSVRGGS
jgi:hypothetical protein